LRRLPHRYPFLFVDRILAVEEGRFARALKSVSRGEPYFAGHFPELPLMPGVLLIEAMAQTAALAQPRSAGELGVLVGIDKARFRRPVVPGDQVVLEAEIRGMRLGVGVAACRALVGEEVVAEAEIRFAIRRLERERGT